MKLIGLEVLPLFWKVEAAMRLRQGDASRFERLYPAPPWREHYSGNNSLPLFATKEKILVELKAGLTAPPASPVTAKVKKKRK